MEMMNKKILVGIGVTAIVSIVFIVYYMENNGTTGLCIPYENPTISAMI